eukprot:TRINITY_DN71532_c0_g1_i1.p1 TRINITY_DN71532_c0_g1~~TRINITY_DN71532_c0_g1_i1.p1  ORF type:complete len:138 (+),score=21.51 TRINITY_DN71532_c0_g1_i1:1-414(+)
MEMLVPSDSDESAALKAARSALGFFPLAEAMEDELLPELRDICLWALSVDDIRRAVSHGRPEAAIMDEKGDTHRADLLYMTADEALVIEYKTGQPSPEHRTQVRKYLSLLKKMTGPPATMRGLIVYLDERNTEEVNL